MANAFDEFSQESNAFDEFSLSPEAIATITAPETVAEKLAAPKSMWDIFTTPIQPQPFSGKDVLAEGAIGAGIGAALGAPTLVGAPAGALTGGILGLTGGMAGEISRSMGNTPATTLAAETAFGLGTQTLGIGAKAVTGLLPWKGRVVARMLPGRLEENASKIVGEKMFGKDTYDILHSTENSEAVQNALKTEIFGADEVAFGQNIGKKASTILRDNYYNTLQRLKETNVVSSEVVPATFDKLGMKVTEAARKTTSMPNVFSTSPEYKLLLEDVAVLAKRDRMRPAEVVSLQKILRNELSKDPKIAATSRQDVLNLLQNGGVYTVAKKGAEVETKTKIPEDARKALIARFDQYLERNVGEKQYSVLKAAEKQEFIAEAKDTIPTLLDEQLRIGSPSVDNALALINQSPTGKQDVINAYQQQIKSLDSPEAMLKYHRTNASKLRELGILDRQTSMDISKKIAAIPKGVSDIVRKQTLKNILIFPAVSTTAAEVVGNDVINPLNFFNM